jgi:hypothetical protein
VCADVDGVAAVAAELFRTACVVPASVEVSEFEVVAMALRVVVAAVEWLPAMHATSPTTATTLATPFAKRVRWAG